MSRFRPLPFVLAAAVAVALILAAPFLGEIRRAVLARFPGQFVAIVSGVVVVAVVAALAGALARIRERRAVRYGTVLAALACAGAYAFLTRTGDPQVDAVERFHFVEYGIVTLLFYRAWRPAADVSGIVLPILAGILVGTVEEWFQWFIPARVGEVKDVFLNGVAILCGLAFSVAVFPVSGLTRVTGEALRRIGAFAAVVVVVFAAFFQDAHLGHHVKGDGWAFRSPHPPASLEALAADRAAAWAGAFVPRPARLSAEDQYMTEGLWHVQRRNRAWAEGDAATAWRENQILERHFAPVLDTPSYVSKTGHRWAPAHRGEAEQKGSAAGAGGTYESDAHPAAIFVWPRGAYWAVVLLSALALAAPGWMRWKKTVTSSQ